MQILMCDTYITDWSGPDCTVPKQYVHSGSQPHACTVSQQYACTLPQPHACTVPQVLAYTVQCRCYPGVNDLDEFDCEEGDTVTLENPAYDKSFSNKGFEVHINHL